MFEKVNPSHPDKVADRIAGALVDIAYSKQQNPKIAVEVLIGHGIAHIICETSVHIDNSDVEAVVKRIGGNLLVDYHEVPQDIELSKNQATSIRCGDNGIFKGVPVSDEEKKLTKLVADIYKQVPFDGKYIIHNDKIIMCQSHIDTNKWRKDHTDWTINPLGDWTGGTDVDSGATNRKLGSDMARSATGGGLIGKDLSKADVSINIYAWLKAQETGQVVELCCAIGDETVDGKPYAEIVEIARQFINKCGGFEKFAEWGLVR